MQNIVLDFCMAMTPEGIQEYLASVFHFPDYYGKNLDAFYDMLTGMGGQARIQVLEPPLPPQDAGTAQYLCRVKQVLRDAESENPGICVVFTQREDGGRAAAGENILAEEGKRAGNGT